MSSIRVFDRDLVIFCLRCFVFKVDFQDIVAESVIVDGELVASELV